MLLGPQPAILPQQDVPEAQGTSGTHQPIGYYYVSVTVFGEALKRNQPWPGLAISSGHSSQELAQNIKLILPKLGPASAKLLSSLLT